MKRLRSDRIELEPGRFVKICLGVTLLLILWANRATLFVLIERLGDREAVTHFIEYVGGWGPALLVSVLSLQVVSAFIPGHAVMAAGGYLYGFGYGLLFNLIGTVVASQIVFVAVRRLGRPIVQQIAPDSVLNRWQGVAQQQNFIFFLLFFWFPVIPSNLMNFVAGLSAISFWQFLGANLLGRFPGVVLITWVGSHGLALSLWQWLATAALGLCLLGLGRYITHELSGRFLTSRSP